VTSPAPPHIADLGQPHRLILVRHGQTSHTVAQLISGAGFAPEPELDESGRCQASSAGARLAALGTAVDDVLTSPMLRARQTAALVAAELGLTEPAPAPDWAEAHFGDWEGLTVADVVRRFPGAWETMIADPANMPPGGESLADVRSRVLQGWRSLVRPGRTSLVVTHLTPIRIVVAEALGTPHEAFPRVLVAPGSITVVDRWADGGVAVAAMGERPDCPD
jgi:probable phosphoglycerate mutase